MVALLSNVFFLMSLLANLWLCSRLVGARERSARPLSLLAYALLVLLPVILFISWFSLILGELGRFTLVNLSLGLLGAALLLAVYLKSRAVALFSLPRVVVDRYEIIAIVALLLFGFLYAKPAEWVLGGADPGAYVNIGVNIAKTGSILIYDEALDNVPYEYGRFFSLAFSRRLPNYYHGVKFPAFYMLDVEEGLLVPQFFHVFPMWIAIFYLVGGLKLSIFATPLFGWLALVALYLLGRRLIHPAAGVVAMGLLGINISQIWFARNPFADIVLQFFLVAAFWVLALFVDAMEQGRPRATGYALLAGATFGMAHLVKLDVFIVPPIILGFVGYAWLTGKVQRPHFYLLGLYLVLLGHTIVHGYFYSYPYVVDVLKTFTGFVRVGIAAGFVGIPVLAWVVWQRQRVAGWVGWMLHDVRVRRAFVVVVLILSLYAYFVRPFRAEIGNLPPEAWKSQGQFFNRLKWLAQSPQTHPFGAKIERTYVEEGMTRVGWYLTPIGVWLGVAGFLYWIVCEPEEHAIPFLSAAFLSAVLFFYRGALYPYFFWAFKRYVPLVIPALLLCVVFLLWRWWEQGRLRWEQRILPLVVGAYLGLSFTFGSMMFWEHVEYEGAIQQVSKWAKRLPEDGIYLIERTSASDMFGAPLNYIYERDAFPVLDENLKRPEVREAIAAWLESGRRVYWISGNCEPIPDYPVELVSETAFSFSMVSPEVFKLPDHISRFNIQVCVYQIRGTESEWTIPENLMARFVKEPILLLGYDVNQERSSSDELLCLDLYWKAEGSVPQDYQVFVHLLDEDMQLYGQGDHTATKGRFLYPPSMWKPGEIVVDKFCLSRPQDFFANDYHLSVGLYSLDTMQRLSVSNGSTTKDHVVLESLKITDE